MEVSDVGKKEEVNDRCVYAFSEPFLGRYVVFEAKLHFQAMMYSPIISDRNCLEAIRLSLLLLRVQRATQT